MESKPLYDLRRIVTTHDERGVAVVQSDSLLSSVVNAQSLSYFPFA